MGTLFFVLTVVGEVILVVFGLRTKSDHTRAKGFLRVGALTGFVLLILLKIIDWDIRYYVLAAVLLLLAVLGVVGIIRRQEKTTAFKAGRVVLRAAGMTVLFFLVTMPAIVFPQYRPLPVTGRYQVSTATSTYVDTSRIETYANTGDPRKVTVSFWYPDNADGKYPLVVFSHGGISRVQSNESLYRELASHGYVVASVGHTYHTITTTDEGGHTTWIDQGYMRELQTEDAKTNKQQSYEFYLKWMKIRMDDINFVIDRILVEAGNQKADTLYGLVDTAAIGVMGHSLGGSAALGIGRVRDDVSAVIALESPFLYDIKGVKDGEFVFADEVYPVPMLNAYSDSTWSDLANLPQYAQNQTYLSNAHATAFNVHIRGVGHFSLTDLSLLSPMLARMLDGFPSATDPEDCLGTINKVCLAFFDSYLKKAGAFTAGGTY